MPGSFTSRWPGSACSPRSTVRTRAYGTHSLRRTNASIIYEAISNFRAVQILLGHVKIESTVHYLDVDVEDVLELAERTEV